MTNTDNHFKDQKAPEGFELPAAARTLVSMASLSGWTVGWQWSADTSGNPFVTVHVADRETQEYFKYTWHSRGTGTLRLFGKLHREAGKAVWVEGPSLKAATERVRA